MKPLISYYGGKQRLASKILPLIPPHTVYVEPFAGGASLLFAKPEKPVSNNDHYREVLNDKNNLLVTLYRVARQYPAEVERILKLTPYSRSEHDLAKKICKNPQSHSDIEITWAVVVNCNQSFGNVMNTGWGYGVFGRNDAASWNNYRNQLPDILNRLQNVYIDQLDAIACIKKWDSPQTFFYCDPPYPGTHQGHYSGYSQQDFENLIKCLSNIQGSFLLSCYKNFVVPSDWEKFEFNAVMSAARISNSNKTIKGERKNHQRVECVWRKVSTEIMREELKDLLSVKQLTLFEQNHGCN